MPDAQKIEACDKCAGAGGLESFQHRVGATLRITETRYRVKCAKCGHMTPHFGSAALAVTLWNSWAAASGQADRLAG